LRFGISGRGRRLDRERESERERKEGRKMAARAGRVLRQQCQRLYCTSSSLVYKPPAAHKSLETQEVVLARNCDSIPGLLRSANSLFSQGFFSVSFRFLLNISIRNLCNDLFPEMRSLLKQFGFESLVVHCSVMTEP
jgi:hypothetical protein